MRHRAVIGIEISDDQVRGAYVRQGSAGAQLVGLRSVPTPPGAIDSEGLLNPQALGESVRRVCSELDARATYVVAGLTGCSLVARVMEIPPVPENEIRSVLRGEMDHYRILPAGQSAFDFCRLPDAADSAPQAGEEPVMRVLLMGAEERLAASYRATVDASGMNVAAVEPGSIALLRALFPKLRGEAAVATVVLASTGTDVFITSQGLLQFYRRIDTGAPDLRHTVAQHDSAIPVQQARGGMLVTPEEEEDSQAEAAPTAQDPYNRQSIALLMTEVQRSIDYYVREFPATGETMVVRFAIDGQDAPELFEILRQHLRTTAEMASVADALQAPAEAMAALSGGDAFRYAVAVGLALRGFGGQYEGAPALNLVVGDRVIVERRMAPRAMLLSAAASAVILLGTLGAALVVGNSIARASRTLTQTRNEANALRAEHAARVAQLQRQKTLTEAIGRQSKPLRRAVDFIAASVAREASLSSLVFDANGGVALSGNARSPRIVADVMDTLNMAASFEPVRMRSMTQVDPRNGTGMEFELQTNFAAPVVQAAVPAGQAAAPAGSPAQGGS